MKKMDLSKFGVGVKSNEPKFIDDERLDFDVEKVRDDFLQEDVERYLPWFLKYKIEKFEDLKVTSEIKKILEFIENFKPGKGLLLYGGAGSGKTTTLMLIGNHYDYEIFELNASDSRNKKSIDETVGDAIKQKSLFNKKKFILVDEVDGISGTYDRGGVSEIVKYLKQSTFPIVFTANDKDSDKIKVLKKVCVTIDFENHSKELLMGIAGRIFKNEKIDFEKERLEKFVEERNTIDIRGFINDLQVSVFDSKFEPCENLELRNYKKKIEELLDKIYFSYPEDAYRFTFNSDVSIDDIFLYLEENTVNAYTKSAFLQAFNEISKADVFRGRIRKWQYWRFLVYVNFYLTYAVCADKAVPLKVIYKRNQRILKKWIYANKFNALRARTKAEKEKGLPEKFLERLAKFYATSAKRCRSRDLFYFVYQYKNDVEFQKAMDEKLSITSEIKKSLLEL